MSLTENGGTTMLVQPSGFGGGFGSGFGGDGWWILLLLLAFGGGWGGMGGFGGGDVYPWLNNSQHISDGFRDQMLQTGISSIGDKITSGFGDVATALCGGFAGVNANITNAAMTNLQSFNGLQAQLAQCCCDNRLATCQTQNIVSTEAAATRSTIQAVGQTILDKMCQDKIDAKNEKIVELNNRINSLEANNYVQNALTAQTQYFLSLYPPTPAAI